MVALRLLLSSTLPCLAAVIAVSLRCGARIKVGKYSIHDLVMVVAMIFGVTSIVCYVHQISLGLGSPIHQLEGDVRRFAQLLEYRFLHQVLVVTALGLAKISICLWLLPLASPRAVPKYYLRSLQCGVMFMTIFTIASAFTIIFQCTPIAAAWDHALRLPPIGAGTARCFSLNTFSKIGLVNGVIHIVTDVLLVCLPLRLIFLVKISKGKRAGALLILSLGNLATIAGIIRQVVSGPLDELEDYALWNFLELHLCIISASLPALREFKKRPKRCNTEAKSDRKVKVSRSTGSISLEPLNQTEQHVAYGNTTAVDGGLNLDKTTQGSSPHVSRNGILVVEVVEIESGDKHRQATSRPPDDWQHPAV